MILTNNKRNLYIPYVFILEELQIESQFSELTQVTEQTNFLVSVHKKHLKQILNSKSLEILPQLPKEVVLNQLSKRTWNYEITL